MAGSRDAQAGNPPTVEQDDHCSAERRERGSAQRDAQQQAHHNAVGSPGYLAGEGVLSLLVSLPGRAWSQAGSALVSKEKGFFVVLPPLACICPNCEKQTQGGLKSSDRAFPYFFSTLGARTRPATHTGRARHGQRAMMMGASRSSRPSLRALAEGCPGQRRRRALKQHLRSRRSQ